MPQSVTVENNFSAGLKTEFTGLNFPEHAFIEGYNVIPTKIGNIYNRLGFDYEDNYVLSNVSRTNKAISTYVWRNAGGDGNTMLIVKQIGGTLYFYKASSATTASPLSDNKLVTTVTLSTYLVVGSSLTIDDIECQYADGNGYLFIFHPSLEPIYCSFSSNTVTPNSIAIQTRDFAGLPDSLDISTRPSNLTAAHKYNLTNQGWVTQPTWSGRDTSSVVVNSVGLRSFTIATGLTITVGQQVRVYNAGWGYPTSPINYGIVNSYNSGTGALVINVQTVEPLVSGVSFTGNATVTGIYTGPFTITPYNTGYIGDFFTSQAAYPSNADVWWYFKNSSGVFDPTTMVPKVTQNSGRAPQGHNIFNTFNRLYSGYDSTLTDVSTSNRPSTGCWFQGRVWYTGVDSSFPASGTAPYTTWTESIYFSQIITDSSQFGMCYQVNDPTSEDLMQLLPSDGGVIQIQGCGSIIKLFPVQNGLLVFAANGIWFITGSQGIGFSATDYTVTKISSVQALSAQSFVNVDGLPIFWNEDAIYAISPSQQGLGLTVDPITVGSIASFYEDIPKISKRFARGGYDSIDYVIKFIYRSTPETTVSSRYEYDRILNFNTYTKAFYPYTISSGPYIHSVEYIDTPGQDNQYPSGIKYLTSHNNDFTFSEEKNTDYVDWAEVSPVDYADNSYFITGYLLKGGAFRKFQPIYVNMFSDSEEATAYKIQGIWDFATETALGRTSTVQTIYNNLSRFNTLYRRHKIRGHGLSLQLKISAVAGMPFNIIGWTIPDSSNQGS